MPKVEFSRVPTTGDVYSAIMAAHREQLQVHTTYSDPDGMFGGDHCCMLTIWSLKGSSIPFIGAETNWEKDYSRPSSERSSSRLNEKKQWWLYNVKELEDEHS